MMKKRHLLLVLLSIVLLIASCNLEPLDGHDNINNHIFPYLNFTKVENKNEYEVEIVAPVTKAEIPGTYEGDPVITFTGFKNEEDAKAIESLTIDVNVTIQDGALKNASSIQEVKKSGLIADSYWHDLHNPNPQAGYHFYAWYQGDEEIHEGTKIDPENPIAKPLFHVLTTHEQVDPTCTETGIKEYFECPTCSLLFNDNMGLNKIEEPEVLEALGHDYPETWTRYNDQYHSRTCNRCGEVEYEEHQWSSDGNTCTVCQDECTHENKTFVEAVTATCVTPGKKAYYYCNRCNKFFDATDNTIEVTEESLTVTDPNAHSYSTTYIFNSTHHWKECIYDSSHKTEEGEHSYDESGICTVCKRGCTHKTLTKHDIVKPNCVDTGTIEYYECKTCNKLFSDSTAKTEITKDQLTIPVAPNNHKTGLTEHLEVKATCVEEGKKAYYSCNSCEKLFSHEDRTQKVTESDLYIEEDPTNHAVELTHYKRKEATCSATGNIGYYECSECHKYFSDAEGKNNVTNITIEIDPNNHPSELKHYNQVPATCIATGTKEYYECQSCKNKYYDSEAKELVSDDSDLTIKIDDKAHALTGYYAYDDKYDDNVHWKICSRDLSHHVDEEEHINEYKYTSENRNLTVSAECIVCGRPISSEYEGYGGVFDVSVTSNEDLVVERLGASSWRFSINNSENYSSCKWISNDTNETIIEGVAPFSLTFNDMLAGSYLIQCHIVDKNGKSDIWIVKVQAHI